MSVLVVGLSHKSAPVATLERAAVSSDTLVKLLADLAHRNSYSAPQQRHRRSSGSTSMNRSSVSRCAYGRRP